MAITSKVLVTGGAGFIGSNVVRQLLARGERVVGVDNLSDAYDPLLKEWRLAQLTSLPGFHYERLDITDFFALKALFEKYGAAASPPLMSKEKVEPAPLHCAENTFAAGDPAGRNGG